MAKSKTKKKAVKKTVEKKEVLEEFDHKVLEGRKTKLDEIYKEPEKVEIEPEKEEEVYAFPTKSRCTRCGGTKTIRRFSEKNKQYRRCRRIGCGTDYCVKGTLI